MKVRAIISMWVLMIPLVSAGQIGTFPMGRAMNDRLLPGLHAYGSTVHSAIKPYRYRDVRGLDTLSSLLPLLEKWAGRSDTIIPGFTETRGGPLLDASVGIDVGKDDPVTYRAGGGFWVEMDAGPKWSFHLDAQGWYTALPAYLDSFTFATGVIPGQGYVSDSAAAFTHYDINGYVNFSPNKFFDLSIGRGKHFFGEGYRSLFLSDNAYSYPYLRISTNVWKVRYVNLFTQMSDIRGAQGDPSDFLKKYASMHYLSWNISKRVNFSVFEAIVWQSNDSDFERGFDVNYLNPVIFYRPVEFGLGSPDNALLGFSFNVKFAKKGMFYSQLMFDEFLLNEIRDGTGWFANKQAFQLGAVLHDVGDLSGLSIRSEINFVRPFMYTHSDTRQNYAHHGEALAHPFGSNFWEWLSDFSYRKDRLTLRNTFSIAEMGQDTGQFSWGNNIFRPENDRVRQPGNGPFINRGFYLLDPVKSTLIQNQLRASYLIAPASGLELEVSYLFRSLTSESGQDRVSNWFNLGIVSYFRQRDPFNTVRYSLQ